MEKIKKFNKKTFLWLNRIISSNYFFVLVIFLFVIQAGWVALGYKNFLLFDENFHFNAIKAFDHYNTPFIVNQDPKFDSLGSLTYGSASIYHYLMSLVYKVAGFVTSDEILKIKLLRLLNISLVATGLVFFRRLFKGLKVSDFATNLGLLVFATLPLIGNVAATINYDNAIFLLTPLTLLFLVKTISDKPSFANFLLFLIFGALGSLMKFSFLPLFFFAIIFALVKIYKKPGFKKYFAKLKKDYKLNKLLSIIFSVIIILLLLLGAQRYIVSVAQYGTPIPDCEKTMTKSRCDKNPVNRKFIELKEGAKDRDKLEGGVYVNKWLSEMMLYGGYTPTYGPSGTKKGSTPHIYVSFIALFILFSIVVSLLFWSRQKTALRRSWWTILFVLIGYTFILLVFNMLNYYEYVSDINRQPRYMMIVLPALFVLALELFFVTNKNKMFGLKNLMMIVAAFCLLQGAGIITQIVASDESWYWTNSKMIQVKKGAEKILLPIIDEE